MQNKTTQAILPVQVLITKALNNARQALSGLVNFIWGTCSVHKVYYCLIA